MDNTIAEYSYNLDGSLKYSIGAAFKKEYDSAMDLAWITFNEFVAPYYPKQGIDSFKEFICDPLLFRMFSRGEYQVFLARSNASIIGMATLRNQNQISLLFVDKNCHKMGVGQALVEHIITELKSKNRPRITVNSSPYAIGFYHKIGFRDANKKLTVDGITFTPMAKNLLL